RATRFRQMFVGLSDLSRNPPRRDFIHAYTKLFSNAITPTRDAVAPDVRQALELVRARAANRAGAGREFARDAFSSDVRQALRPEPQPAATGFIHAYTNLFSNAITPTRDAVAP